MLSGVQLCVFLATGALQLAAAVLAALEGLPLRAVGLPALLADPAARSLEEALVHAVVEARRAAPAVLFLPHLQVRGAGGGLPCLQDSLEHMLLY